MSEEVQAIYEGSLVIAGIEVQLYVLDDGRRILDLDGVNQLLAFIADGGELTEGEALALVSAKDRATVMKRLEPPRRE